MNKLKYKYRSVKYLLLVCFLLVNHCLGQTNDSSNYTREIIQTTDNNTPTVNIDKFILIVKPLEDRKNDAIELVKLKRRWALAMQSLDPSEFEDLLGKNFTFAAGEDKLLIRDSYIKNRTTPDIWKITDVKYFNMTIQFFGDLGIVSYNNRVKNVNDSEKQTEIEYIGWVDIFAKEDGKWKLSATQVVDFRMESEPYRSEQ